MSRDDEESESQVRTVNKYNIVDGNGTIVMHGISNLRHAFQCLHMARRQEPDRDLDVVDTETGEVVDERQTPGFNIEPLNRDAPKTKHVAREDSIVTSILKILNDTKGVKAQKWHGSVMSRNNPDIFGCAYGRMFVIEVKRPGESATTPQMRELEQWGQAGAIACVMTEAGDARELLEMMGDAESESPDVLSDSGTG